MLNEFKNTGSVKEYEILYHKPYGITRECKIKQFVSPRYWKEKVK